VRRPAAAAAAARLPEFPGLGVGLHLEVGEYRAQLERFRKLVGRAPDHLDSHKHVHETEPVSAVAEALAAEFGIPLRNRQVRYEGSFFAREGDGTPRPEAIAPERLTQLIRSLPPGWTEIGCHPAAGPVPMSSYDSERQLELQTLIDPQVKNLLNVSDVQLCSFAQVGAR
jgi:chitin disaccharide deacetylase